ncbi:MAG: hypothetical protein Q9223_000191 [Gallowayella weberi]
MPGIRFRQRHVNRIACSRGDDIDGFNDDLDEDFVARNGRQRTSYTTASPDTQLLTPKSPRRPAASLASSISPNMTAHAKDEPGSVHSAVPYYVASTTTNSVRQDQEVTNETAAALFHTPINTPGDALHLLLEASGRTESLQEGTGNDQEHRPNLPSPNSHSTGRSRLTRPGPPASLRHRKENIDPAIARSSGSQHLADSPEITDALRAWSRLRFVRAGWFTAREAISYID